MKHRGLRTLYILLLTQTFSLIGSRMTSFAIGIRVYQDTERVTPLALVGFFSVLPTILVAGVAGVLADRWDRRKVMALADAGQAATTLLLLISFASGVFELWHLYVLTTISTLFGIFQGPAFMASVTMLIEDEHRDRANAIQQITGPAAGLVAPVLAGVMYAAVGITGVMAFDLFTFGVAMTVVLLTNIPTPPPSEEGEASRGSMWRESTSGMRALWARRPFFVLILAATAVNFLLAGALMPNTAYILALTDSEAVLGVLMALMSAGPLVGGLIMGAWGGTRPRIHTIMIGIALEGLFLALYGISRHPIALGASIFFVLIPIPFVDTAIMSIFQIKIPPDLQGRVISAIQQIAQLLMPVSYLLVGPLADEVLEPAVGTAAWEPFVPLVGTQTGAGMGLLMVICGALITGVTLAFYALPMIRHLERDLPDYAVTIEDADPASIPPDEAAAVPAR